MWKSTQENRAHFRNNLCASLNHHRYLLTVGKGRKDAIKMAIQIKPTKQLKSTKEKKGEENI